MGGSFALVRTLRKDCHFYRSLADFTLFVSLAMRQMCSWSHEGESMLIFDEILLLLVSA